MMTLRKPFLCALAAALAAFAPRVHAAAKTQILVICDFTQEGRKVPHPDAQHPTFYLPVITSFEQLGSRIAGEKAPDMHALIHLVAVELARQGYFVANPAPYVNATGELTYADGTPVLVPEHPSRRQGLVLNQYGDEPLTVKMLESPTGPYSLRATPPEGMSDQPWVPPARKILAVVDPKHGPVMARMPSIILSIHYGCMNPMITNMDPGGDPGAQVFFNENQMLALVGGNTLSHLDLDFEKDQVRQASEENRYFVMLSAFDYNAYVSGRKKVLLWQAKMSAPSDGVNQFADAMDALVKAGGPFFGRETERPKALLLPITPEGTVQIGTPTVTDYSEAPLPPATAKPSH